MGIEFEKLKRNVLLHIYMKKYYILSMKGNIILYIIEYDRSVSKQYISPLFILIKKSELEALEPRMSLCEAARFYTFKTLIILVKISRK